MKKQQRKNMIYPDISDSQMQVVLLRGGFNEETDVVTKYAGRLQ